MQQHTGRGASLSPAPRFLNSDLDHLDHLVHSPHLGRHARPNRLSLALHAMLAATVTGVVVAGAVLPRAAWAQAAPAGSDLRHYEIPSGPLEATLNRLGRESGVLIAFGSAATEGLRSEGVSGRYAVEDALKQALKGTRLGAVRTAGGYALQVLPVAASAASAANADAATLKTVTVKASATGLRTTEGSGSYTTPATSAATGLSLSLRDTPQSVSVLTRQQIDDQQLISLNEALRSVTGIYAVSSDSDRTDFYARGFYIDNIQYDGVPTSLGLSFYGDSGNDTTIYDRVEVVRGATGLLSGAGNPSASINLVRKRADSKVLTGTVSAALGSWGRQRGTVDLSTPITEDGRIRGRLAAMVEERDSHVDLYHARKQVLYGVIDADLTPSTRLSIGADYQSNRPTGSTWGGLPLVFSNGQPTDWDTSKTTAAHWTHWSSSNRTVFANLQHAFDNGWKLKANFSHRESDYDAKLLYLYRQPNQATGAGMVALPNYSEYTFQQNSADLQATGPFQLLGRNHEMVAGVTSSRARELQAGHARTSVLQDTGNFYQWDGSYAEPSWGPLTVRRLDSTRQDGFYSAVRFSLADSLKLILGGRYNHWEVRGLTETRRHDVFTPYAGLVYDINDSFSAYASYTDIFQPQNYRDRTGTRLDPVTGKSLEAGIKGEHLDGRLHSAFSVFRIAQDNVARLDGDNLVPGSSDLAYVGAKGVTSKGFEVQLSGELASGWNLSTGLSRTIATDADGGAFNTWAPRTQLQLFTSYRLRGDWQKLTVGGGANWQNRTYSDVASTVYVQKAFGTVNLMARYAMTPQLALQVNLNNLLDKKHYVNIGGQGQYGTPRNALVALSYKF